MPLDSFVRGVGTHSKDEKGPELYPTPECATQALLDNHTLGRLVLEPAAGLGHMVKVLERDHLVTALDLHDYGSPLCRTTIVPDWDFPRDYLSLVPADSKDGLYDSLVTNPPFSLAADFVRCGLHVAQEVCILQRVAFMESKGRLDLWKSLRKVFVMVDRLPMMHRWVPDEEGVYREWPGKKAASSMAFAWFVFSNDWDGATHGATLRMIRCRQSGG